MELATKAEHCRAVSSNDSPRSGAAVLNRELASQFARILTALRRIPERSHAQIVKLASIVDIDAQSNCGG